jgi:predicted dehydrogenase
MTFVSSPKAANLRVAVIGLGRMGVRHIDAVRRLGMTVCGVADISQRALQAVRSSHDIEEAACFVDAGEMLRTVRPEALIVATTAPSHAALVLCAVDFGVHYILCEKPMATSLADAEAMIDACERAGVELAINHQMRFMPQWSRVKALIGTDELGPLSSILVAGSNFGLAMNAGHYFEVFRYISDTSVQMLHAWLEPQLLENPRGPNFEDRSGRIIAWGEGGQSIYVDLSAAAGHGMNTVYICRFGQIVVDELGGSMRVIARRSDFRDLPTTRYAMPADVRELAIEPFDTVAPTMELWLALLEGRPYPNGITGLHSLACLVAAHVSHEAAGCAVRLDDPTLPRHRQFKWA